MHSKWNKTILNFNKLCTPEVHIFIYQGMFLIRARFHTHTFVYADMVRSWLGKLSRLYRIVVMVISMLGLITLAESVRFFYRNLFQFFPHFSHISSWCVPLQRIPHFRSPCNFTYFRSHIKTIFLTHKYIGPIVRPIPLRTSQSRIL